MEIINDKLGKSHYHTLEHGALPAPLICDILCAHRHQGRELGSCPAQGQRGPSNFICVLSVSRKLPTTNPTNAEAINAEHAQLNKLFKCMATNSQVFPFGGGPAAAPPIHISFMAAKQISKDKTPEGLPGAVCGRSL